MSSNTSLFLFCILLFTIILSFNMLWWWIVIREHFYNYISWLLMFFSRWIISLGSTQTSTCLLIKIYVEFINVGFSSFFLIFFGKLDLNDLDFFWFMGFFGGLWRWVGSGRWWDNKCALNLKIFVFEANWKVAFVGFWFWNAKILI